MQILAAFHWGFTVSAIMYSLINYKVQSNIFSPEAYCFFIVAGMLYKLCLYLKENWLRKHKHNCQVSLLV